MQAGCSGANADLWQEVGKALQSRGRAGAAGGAGGAEAGANQVTVIHLNSHLGEDEARARGVPQHAWEGNSHADALADEGAQLHAIGESRTACYEWARATSSLTRSRIAAATEEVLARRPGADRETRARRAAARRAARAGRVKKAALLDPSAPPTSSHELVWRKRGGWQCTACGQSVARSSTRDELEAWLGAACAGAAPLHGRGLQLRGAVAHMSHSLRRRPEGEAFGYFCIACGSVASEYISKKMRAPGLGASSGKPGAYALQHRLQRAAAEAR